MSDRIATIKQMGPFEVSDDGNKVTLHPGGYILTKPITFGIVAETELIAVHTYGVMSAFRHYILAIKKRDGSARRLKHYRDFIAMYLAAKREWFEGKAASDMYWAK